MKICVVGGAGYVGSALVPHLLSQGHEVTVLDIWWFGDHLEPHKNLTKIAGDIRNKLDLERSFHHKDAVIHLACVSNDPSFDMNAELGKSINYDCFKLTLDALHECGVPKFIYASSSSVYGISDDPDVKENSPKKPLTDYSKFKLACEVQLQTFGTGGQWTILRPATVCGYSPRLRLDLVVNIFAINALVNKRITVFGGAQKRPNINIRDMVLAYDRVLNASPSKVDQQIFNVGYENKTLDEIADLVKKVVGEDVRIDHEATKDERSYHVNSEKFHDIYLPSYDVAYAISSIATAYKEGQIRNAMKLSKYRNVERMKELGL